MRHEQSAQVLVEPLALGRLGGRDERHERLGQLDADDRGAPQLVGRRVRRVPRQLGHDLIGHRSVQRGGRLGERGRHVGACEQRLDGLPGVDVLPFDVTDPDAVRGAAGRVAGSLGGRTLRAVINNAGLITRVGRSSCRQRTCAVSSR